MGWLAPASTGINQTCWFITSDFFGGGTSQGTCGISKQDIQNFRDPISWEENSKRNTLESRNKANICGCSKHPKDSSAALVSNRSPPFCPACGFGWVTGVVPHYTGGTSRPNSLDRHSSTPGKSGGVRGPDELIPSP